MGPASSCGERTAELRASDDDITAMAERWPAPGSWDDRLEGLDGPLGIGAGRWVAVMTGRTSAIGRSSLKTAIGAEKVADGAQQDEHADADLLRVRLVVQAVYQPAHGEAVGSAAR